MHTNKSPLIFPWVVLVNPMMQVSSRLLRTSSPSSIRLAAWESQPSSFLNGSQAWRFAEMWSRRIGWQFKGRERLACKKTKTKNGWNYTNCFPRVEYWCQWCASCCPPEDIRGLTISFWASKMTISSPFILQELHWLLRHTKKSGKRRSVALLLYTFERKPEFKGSLN